MNKIAIIYCRVSTNRQGDTGHSLESQKQRLVAEAEAAGYTAEVITEIGSGKRDTRPKLLAALADLKDGKAAALFCLDLDRLARSTKNALEIYEMSKKQGWRLRVVSLGIDTGTAAGEMIFTVMAGFAQFESRLTSERVLRQHEARRERGIIWGVDEGFRGNLDLETRRLIKHLHEEGLTLRQIITALDKQGRTTPRGGVWYPATVKAILESPQTKLLQDN